MMEIAVNLRKGAALSAVHDAASAGLQDALEHILNVSNEHVPLEYEDLEASGRVAVDGLEGAISYDTPYAVIQHEDLTFNHDAGRTAKYLENAINSEKNAALAYIARKIGGIL